MFGENRVQEAAAKFPALKAAAPILASEGLVRRGVVVAQVVDQLIDPSFGTQAIARQ